jgi:hypothetical protein
MKKIVPYLIFILCLTAGVAGIPSWPKTETAVDYYKISKNPYGIAIYQDGLHASVEFNKAKTFTISGNTILIPGANQLTYGRDDIVFDKTNIYTDPPQDQIDYLKMTKADTSVLPNTVFLVNPHIPGELELRGTNLHIDLTNKQINGPIDVVIVHDTI